MEIDENALRKFLIIAKKNTYATGNKNASPERKDFDELEYKTGDFYYRDSYYGFFHAPGQEIVRYKDEPVWNMSYNGGMRKGFEDVVFAKETYTFLKKVLGMVEEKNPYRGPAKVEDGDFLYTNEIEGNIEEFKGIEKIFFKGKEVFRQDYVGGLVMNKEEHCLK